MRRGFKVSRRGNLRWEYFSNLLSLNTPGLVPFCFGNVTWMLFNKLCSDVYRDVTGRASKLEQNSSPYFSRSKQSFKPFGLTRTLLTGETFTLQMKKEYTSGNIEKFGFERWINARFQVRIFICPHVPCVYFVFGLSCGRHRVANIFGYLPFNLQQPNAPPMYF